MSERGKLLYFDPAEAPRTASHEAVDVPFDPALTASDVLAHLVSTIRACGQDPVTQLEGYLITEDPTYLPEGAHARLLAERIGRDKLLSTLIESYLRHTSADSTP